LEIVGDNGAVMDLVVSALATGVLGTMVMDVLNHLLSRSGMILKIDVGMIGRMSAGWAHGRFRYRHPSEIEPVTHELPLGYLSHYAIGVTLALIYLIGWRFLIGGAPSAAWALVFGIATTVASHFFVFPSMGLGVCGRLSPDGIKAPLSALVNHLFFGVGMAVAIAFV
jgi:hypothetical protein